MAAPTAIGAQAIASRWITSPPRRLMAPATPPPMIPREFAGFTIASTGTRVMSAFATWTCIPAGPSRTDERIPIPASPRQEFRGHFPRLLLSMESPWCRRAGDGVDDHRVRRVADRGPGPGGGGRLPGGALVLRRA